MEFPYYKNFYHFTPARFKELAENLSPEILTYNPSPHPLEPFGDGAYFIIRENWDKNAELNNMTDCFTEYARIKCEFRGNKSPIDYWAANTSKYDGMSPATIREQLYKDAHYCNNFRISVAITILKYFAPKSWLDISAGWGDRLLAAIACNVEYMAADPNKDLHEGYDAIRTALNVSPAQYTIEYNGFEHIRLRKKYDLVFTSPPFFDLEVYSTDDHDSLTANPTADAWYTKFLVPALYKAYTHLADNGHMVLYIAESTAKREKAEFSTTDYVAAMKIMLDSLMQYRGSIYYYYEKSDGGVPNAAGFRRFYVWKKCVMGFTQTLAPKYDPPALSIEYARFCLFMKFVAQYPSQAQCVAYYVVSIAIIQNKYLVFDDALYKHFCANISVADFKLLIEEIDKLNPEPITYEKFIKDDTVTYKVDSHNFDLPISAYKSALAKYIDGLVGNPDDAILQCLIRYNTIHYGRYKPRVIEYWGHECYGDVFDVWEPAPYHPQVGAHSYSGMFYDLERAFCSTGPFMNLNIKNGTYAIRIHPRFWGTGLLTRIHKHAARASSAVALYKTTTLMNFDNGGVVFDRPNKSGKKDRYYMSARPPAPILQSFLNTEFPNPPPKILQFKEAIVFDDSELYGGTKERAMGEFLLHIIDLPESHMHFPASSNGLGMVALTRAVGVLRDRGINITAHIYSNGIMSSSIAYCKDNGAVVNFYPKTAFRDIYPLIKKNAENDAGGIETNLGGDNPIFIEVLTRRLRQLNLCEGRTDINMWLVYGSGTIYAAMQAAYPQFAFHLVVVGRKPGKIRPQDKVYEAPQSFYEPSSIRPPYKTELTYDGKLWQFVLQHPMKNTYVWNVGYLPKLRENKYREYRF